MGRCLLSGLIADGYSIQRLRVSDVSADRLRLITNRFPVSTSTDNTRVVQGADVQWCLRLSLR